MRGERRVAKAPAGECGVKSQVSCGCFICQYHMQAMNRRSTFEKLFREDRSGETIQVIRKEMHLGAEKGKAGEYCSYDRSVFSQVSFSVMCLR